MLLVTGDDSHVKVTGMHVGKLQLNLYKRRAILAQLSFYLTLKETKLQQSMTVFFFSYMSDIKYYENTKKKLHSRARQTRSKYTSL